MQSMDTKVLHMFMMFFSKSACISSFGEHLTSTVGNASCMKITWHHSERPGPFVCLSETLQVSVQLLRGAILRAFKRPWNKVTLRKVW